jgi:hypothetical protein
LILIGIIIYLAVNRKKIKPESTAEPEQASTD